MSFFSFLMEYYIWIILILIVLIIGVVGFLVDSKNKKAKANMESVNHPVDNAQPANVPNNVDVSNTPVAPVMQSSGGLTDMMPVSDNNVVGTPVASPEVAPVVEPMASPVMEAPVASPEVAPVVEPIASPVMEAPVASPEVAPAVDANATNSNSQPFDINSMFSNNQ